MIGRFPELEHLDAADRAEVLGRLPWWTYPVIVLRSVLLGIVAGGIVAGMLERVGVRSPLMVFMVLVGPGVVASYAWQLSEMRRQVREEIAHGFEGERPPFCFGCGYDLRESRGGYCPGCGRVVGRGGTIGEDEERGGGG